MQNQQVEQVITMMSEGYLASFRSIEKTLTHVANTFGMGWSALSILYQISNGTNLSTSDLTHTNNISKGAISLQLTELLNRNLIKIREDDHDRRRHILELTKRGQSLANRVRVQAGEIAQSVVNNMSLDEMQRLHTDFALFAQTLSDTSIK
ncbi:MAG TPA: MarR family transcriptional regulator [Lactobacillus sp.]|nr:MarR family transcriptional regulator [Lactobacillus sp.]